MHADEIVTTPEQVRALVACQFPQWVDLEVTPVAEQGTDHCLFRLGGALAVRMPRVAWAAGQAVSDARWLPSLAPHLPLEVPVPLATGDPTDDYPWPWSVVPWLPGAPPTAYVDGTDEVAADLARFVRALHAAPGDGGPVAGPGGRGAPLHHWDDAVREAVAASGDRIDEVAVLRAWDDALTAPTHEGPPGWIHGDLMAGNVLVQGGRLTGVIDFGALALGDPAPDLVAAYQWLSPTARRVFRDALDHDDDTWRRARGWAIGPAVTGIAYYWDTVPAFARRGQCTLEVVLGEIASDA